MLYKFQYFIVIILICISCSSPKEQIIQDFTNHYTAIIESNAEDLSAILSSDSNAFIDTVNSLQDPSLKEMLEVGHTYKIPYYTTLYFTQLKNSNQKNNTANFLKFLSSNSINIFSYHDIYGVSRDNTKTGTEDFIAVFRDLDGRNKLDWVKMQKEENVFKIDLLFILQHAEHRILKDFKDGIQSNFGGDIDQYLEDVFNRDGTTLINDTEHHKLVKKRQEEFPDKFVVK